MPEGIKTSSKPSLLKSPVAMPQGQKLSRPIFSQISTDFQLPRFLKNELPYISLSGLGDHFWMRVRSDFLASSISASVGGIAVHMSECISTMNRSSLPSLLKSNALQPTP